MSVHTFHTSSLSAGDTATVTGDELHHLRDVLRLRADDHIIVSDGAGRQFAAVLESVGRDEAVARILSPVDAPPLTRLTLFQSVLKGAKMDLVVQKATELGVRAIVPVRTERCVAKIDSSNLDTKLGRWRRVAAEAAKQCGRASVPEVRAPVDLDEAVGKLGDYAGAIVFWEETRNSPLAEALADVGPRGGVAVFVGPEGGLTSAEVAALTEAGAACAGFGELVLRSETAAIAGVAVVNYELSRQEGAD